MPLNSSMPQEPFKALKVPSNNPSSAPSPTTESNGASELKLASTKPEDISSPHELTAFVETLLLQLENKFDDMSSQVLERMSQMSARVDALENSIYDLINTDVASAPQSPNLGNLSTGRSNSG